MTYAKLNEDGALAINGCKHLHTSDLSCGIGGAE